VAADGRSVRGNSRSALAAELALRTAETRALGELLAASRARLAENREQAKEIRARTRNLRIPRTPATAEDPLIIARRAAMEMERHRIALARLADQRAAAVRLAIGRGLSRAEVARRLGVTPQAITKLLNREAT
jgi:DNA-directed RNA polymerase specialized sigma24 family protein